jgi:hypothetical protein
MSEKIQLRRSSVAGRVPTTSQLDLGEIGINTHDGKVYIKKDAGTPEVVEVGGGYDDLEDIIDDLPSMVSTTYLFDTNSSGNVATASTVHLNSSNWSTATVIYASIVNSKGKRVDMAAMEYLKFGAKILLQDMSGTGTGYLKAICTGASSNSTTITIGINSIETNGDTPSSLANMTLGVVGSVNSYALEEALGFDVLDDEGVGNFTTTELTDQVTLKATLETLGEKAKILREGLGVDVGATDLGNFAGETIANNQTVKGALRNLEQAIENTANAPTALRFKFSSSVGAGPGTGKFRYDSSDTSLIDRIYIHEEDRDSRDNKSFLDYLLKAGSYIYVTSRDEQHTFLARLSSDATYTSDYYTIDLEDTQIAGSLPTADDDLTFGVLPGPAISGTGVPSLKNNTISTYSNNTTAKAAGLVDGDMYRTSDGTLKVVYS